MISITKALFEVIPQTLYGFATPPVVRNPGTVTTAAKDLVKPYTNSEALRTPAGVPARTTPITQTSAPVVKPPEVASGSKAVGTDIASNVAKPLQHNISGHDAAKIALDKGIKSASDTAGSFARKATDFAAENPLAAGVVGGAGLAYGVGKLFNRNKSV